MDSIYDDVRNNRCLVYSYGIADDLTFEEDMASLGCVVHAYDPTVDVKSDDVKIHPVGIAYFTGKLDLMTNYDSANPVIEWLDVMTLADAMAANGDSESHLSYLKVDVESHEIKAI